MSESAIRDPLLAYLSFLPGFDTQYLLVKILWQGEL